MSRRIGPVYAPSDYAGFIRRTAALVLDVVILATLAWGAQWAWYYLGPTGWVTRDSYRWIRTVTYVFSLLYLCGLRLTQRGTLGYRIMGIEYVYMLDERPSRWALAFRAMLAPLLMTFFALDHFWILVDKRKQAWHDKVTGFYVVKRHAQPRATVQMVQRAINFMLLTFIVWEPAGAGENSTSLLPGDALPVGAPPAMAPGRAVSSSSPTKSPSA
ncbi:MAG TPA: RDD family protein [Phycisphaerae bacterium]|nr:RDD family protein [Phycisphaerales bacterium]HRX83875.1 RDD family protein [Phycisphaerae bacterium]